MAWYKVLDNGDAATVAIKKVNAGGKSICLVQDDNHWYALSARCPHAGADLSQGWCANGNIVCPYHRYAYKLHTGRGAPGQHDYVETYITEARADGVYVQIDSLADKIRKLF